MRKTTHDGQLFALESVVLQAIRIFHAAARSAGRALEPAALPAVRSTWLNGGPTHERRLSERREEPTGRRRRRLGHPERGCRPDRRGRGGAWAPLLGFGTRAGDPVCGSPQGRGG